MHKRNSKTLGTILFHENDSDPQNQKLASFLNSLDAKLQETIDAKSQKYNFDFDNDRPLSVNEARS